MLNGSAEITSCLLIRCLAPPRRLTGPAHCVDGCVIYSIGQDLEDDGGVRDEQRWIEGDIIFRLLDADRRNAPLKDG